MVQNNGRIYILGTSLDLISLANQVLKSVNGRIEQKHHLQTLANAFNESRDVIQEHKLQRTRRDEDIFKLVEQMNIPCIACKSPMLLGDLTIVYVNKKMSELFGTSDAIIGKSMKQVIQLDCRDTLESFLFHKPPNSELYGSISGSGKKVKILGYWMGSCALFNVFPSA